MTWVLDMKRTTCGGCGKELYIYVGDPTPAFCTRTCIEVYREQQAAALIVEADPHAECPPERVETGEPECLPLSLSSLSSTELLPFNPPPKPKHGAENSSLVPDSSSSVITTPSSPRDSDG